MDGFEHVETVQVRLRDLDTMNHVNNSVYATYLEQARLGYFRDVVGRRLADLDVVIADLEIQYERPITSDADRVRVGVTVPELGETSVPLEYEVRANDERRATGRTTMVAYDSEAGTPRPVPDEWRERIAAAAGFDDA